MHDRINRVFQCGSIFSDPFCVHGTLRDLKIRYFPILNSYTFEQVSPDPVDQKRSHYIATFFYKAHGRCTLRCIILEALP